MSHKRQWLHTAGHLSRCLAPVLAFVGFAVPAFAQDYAIQHTEQTYLAVPAGTQPLANSGSGFDTTTVELPFLFPYYGREFSEVHVNRSGWAMFSDQPPTGVNSSAPRALPRTDEHDGIVAIRWSQYLASGDGNETIAAWTTGTAPDRRFIIAWDEMPSTQTGPDSGFSFQMHLEESTGVIRFIYHPVVGLATGGSSFLQGIDALGGGTDLRFTSPVNNQTNNSGIAADVILTPTTHEVTGTVRYDRLVTDAAGIGTSVQEDVPLGAHRVELRAGSVVVASAPTDADGTFSLVSAAVPGGTLADVWVVSENDACEVVRPTGGALHEWRVTSGLAADSDQALTAATLDATDATALEQRAAMEVARVVKAARDWVSPLISSPPVRLTVWYDAGVSLTTRYVPGTPPVLHVGSPGAVNPDDWDPASISRSYFRHVLTALAAAPNAQEDPTLDAATSSDNAFATAFGFALWSAMTGDDEVVDGLAADDAVAFDLEDPGVGLPAAEDVAGHVAGALHDLVDGADEGLDTVDGGDAATAVLELVATAATPVTASSFLAAWEASGRGMTGITRGFIGNLVVPDDDDELNGDGSEATLLGPVGSRRSDRLLNRHDEDWFAVSLDAAVDFLLVELAFSRQNVQATVLLEVLDTSGGVLATGAPDGDFGAFQATATDVPAGVVHVRVSHELGERVPQYTIQALEPLTLFSGDLPEWTQGRPFNEPLGLVGGVPPFVISTQGMPSGMGVNQSTAEIVGSPSSSGRSQIRFDVTDDGDPHHAASRLRDITINPPVGLLFDDYYGFADGRVPRYPLPFAGGTSPRVFTLTAGSLPAGLLLDRATAAITGSPAGLGDGLFTLDVVDVAGSADSRSSLAVVCADGRAKGAAFPLGAGGTAAGWFVDVLGGSRLSFSVKTAKKRAKRALRIVVVGPDGALVEEGKRKEKNGSASVKKAPGEETGRYFVIAPTVAGEETELLGSPKVKLPTKAKAVVEGFASGTIVDVAVGALAGGKLKFVAVTDKKSGATVQIQALIRPDDTSFGVGDIVKTKGTKQTLVFDLDQSGTWRVRLAGNGVDPGTLKWSWKVKQPKGGTFEID